MGKPITMKGIFEILEKIAHKPQVGLNDKIRMSEDVVVKLGEKSIWKPRNTSKSWYTPR